MSNSPTSSSFSSATSYMEATIDIVPFGTADNPVVLPTQAKWSTTGHTPSGVYKLYHPCLECTNVKADNNHV